MVRALRSLAAALGIVVVVLVVAGLGYAGFVLYATHAGVADPGGTRAGLAVDGPVTIARDGRGVAHIRATTDHDLFFAQGYAVGSDRLWQLDLLRRYVSGRLAEVLGPPLLSVDRGARVWNIPATAQRTYADAAPDEKAALDAFAAGVNAAAQREPTPPEFRAFFYAFEPWRPSDSVLVGFATTLDLVDSPSDIALRDAVRRKLGDAGESAFFPLGDPRYDAPADGRSGAPLPLLPALPGATGNTAAFAPVADERVVVGSNAWSVGADRTSEHRAMIASDPHLQLRVPGVWWLFEAQSPHLHIAGASLAGTPGVILGHNNHIAWGATNGGTVAMRLIEERFVNGQAFENGQWRDLAHRDETIHVRLGGDMHVDIASTARGVVVAGWDGSSNAPGGTVTVADWPQLRFARSSLSTFFGLDRASSLEDAATALRGYPGPVQNFVMADDRGRAAYHLAGDVLADTAWGTRVYDDASAAGEPPVVPFDQLPHVDPSTDAAVVSANNRSNGSGQPRLAADWAPPYRAFEIHHDLGSARGLTRTQVGAPQFDTTSPAELEFAAAVLAAVDRAHADTQNGLHALVEALRGFDGRMLGDSRGAEAETVTRLAAASRLAHAHFGDALAKRYLSGSTAFEVLLRAVRERPRGWVPHDDYDAFLIASLHDAATKLGGSLPTFGEAAAQPLLHPLAQFGFRLWNGPTLPGRGGAFAPSVQWNAHGQSYRALWVPGDWDHGTIDIDAGESGEPASPHYADQTKTWIASGRSELPFTDAAVQAATVSTLTLTR